MSLHDKIGKCRICSHLWRLRFRDIRLDGGEFILVNTDDPKEELACADCAMKGTIHSCTQSMRDITPLPWDLDPIKQYPQVIIP